MIGLLEMGYRGLTAEPGGRQGLLAVFKRAGSSAEWSRGRLSPAGRRDVVLLGRVVRGVSHDISWPGLDKCVEFHLVYEGQSRTLRDPDRKGDSQTVYRQVGRAWTVG